MGVSNPLLNYLEVNQQERILILDTRTTTTLRKLKIQEENKDYGTLCVWERAEREIKSLCMYVARCLDCHVKKNPMKLGAMYVSKEKNWLTEEKQKNLLPTHGFSCHCHMYFYIHMQPYTTFQICHVILLFISLYFLLHLVSPNVLQLQVTGASTLFGFVITSMWLSLSSLRKVEIWKLQREHPLGVGIAGDLHSVTAMLLWSSMYTVLELLASTPLQLHLRKSLTLPEAFKILLYT